MLWLGFGGGRGIGCWFRLVWCWAGCCCLASGLAVFSVGFPFQCRGNLLLWPVPLVNVFFPLFGIFLLWPGVRLVWLLIVGHPRFISPAGRVANCCPGPCFGVARLLAILVLLVLGVAMVVAGCVSHWCFGSGLAVFWSAHCAGWAGVLFVAVVWCWSLVPGPSDLPAVSVAFWPIRRRWMRTNARPRPHQQSAPQPAKHPPHKRGILSGLFPRGVGDRFGPCGANL